jgi:hypothetical protein
VHFGELFYLFDFHFLFCMSFRVLPQPALPLRPLYFQLYKLYFSFVVHNVFGWFLLFVCFQELYNLCSILSAVHLLQLPILSVWLHGFGQPMFEMFNFHSRLSDLHIISNLYFMSSFNFPQKLCVWLRAL